jgi:hypothetical protein
LSARLRFSGQSLNHFCSPGIVNVGTVVVGKRLPHHSFPARSAERNCSN